MRYKATKVCKWSDNDYDYKDIEYYLVRRAGSLGFEHVPVDGSSKMPDDLMDPSSRMISPTRGIPNGLSGGLSCG